MFYPGDVITSLPDDRAEHAIEKGLALRVADGEKSGEAKDVTRIEHISRFLIPKRLNRYNLHNCTCLYLRDIVRRSRVNN